MEKARMVGKAERARMQAMKNVEYYINELDKLIEVFHTERVHKSVILTALTETVLKEAKSDPNRAVMDLENVIDVLDIHAQEIKGMMQGIKETLGE